MAQAAGYAIGVTYMSPVAYTSQIPDIVSSCHDDQIEPNFFGSETLNSYIRDFWGLELKKLTCHRGKTPFRQNENFAQSGEI